MAKSSTRSYPGPSSKFPKFPPFEEHMKCVSSGQLLDAGMDGSNEAREME